MNRILISYCVLIAFASQLSLRGQASTEELIKAKLFTEQMMKEKRAAESMHIISSGPGGTGKLVRDKPFAAEAFTETVQVLLDGNRIVRRNLTKQYRDGSGRTRREQTIEALGPSSPISARQIVFISDPVAKVDYILDPAAKTLRKFSRSETATAGTTGSGPTESTEVRKEDLGKRSIEGMECTGTRITATIPAGRIGNDRALVTVTETWYSPVIEAVVQSTTTDPRFGETTYHLRGVQRGEQPPQLFEAPADYKLNQ
jgi:hypothetical protein